MKTIFPFLMLLAATPLTARAAANTAHAHTHGGSATHSNAAHKKSGTGGSPVHPTPALTPPSDAADTKVGQTFLSVPPAAPANGADKHDHAGHAHNDTDDGEHGHKHSDTAVAGKHADHADGRAHNDTDGDHDDHGHAAAAPAAAVFSPKRGLTLAEGVAGAIGLKTALAAPHDIAAAHVLEAQTLDAARAIAFLPADTPLPFVVGQRFRVVPAAAKSGTGGSPVHPTPALTPPPDAARSPMECGGLPPLSATSDAEHFQSGGKPPHSKTPAAAQSPTSILLVSSANDTAASIASASRNTGEPPVPLSQPLPAAAATSVPLSAPASSVSFSSTASAVCTNDKQDACPTFATLTHVSRASAQATGQIELLFALEAAHSPLECGTSVPLCARTSVPRPGARANAAAAAASVPLAAAAASVPLAAAAPLFIRLAPETPTAPARAAVTVPCTAVLETATGAFVYVVGEGGNFQRREVRTGTADANRTAILSGLVEGERVVCAAVATLWLTELRLTKGGGHSH